MRILCLIFSFVVFGMAHSAQAACPSIDGIPDYNCDGKMVISFLGDSLVSGFGDTQHKNQGGYVLRVAKTLKNSTINNWGVAGLRTLGLLTMLRNAFDKGKDDELKEDLSNSDIIFIDIGRNDRWLFGEPIEAYRNIKRISSKLVSEITALNGGAPLVVKAVLMLPNRGSQGPWIKELNKLIFASDSESYPADLRFDLVSKRLLSSDQVHPTSAGYAALSKACLNYLKKSVPKKMSVLQKDEDSDNIYDLYETIKYLTDPTKADTDGDGKTDGEEVFSTKTNPLLVD